MLFPRSESCKSCISRVAARMSFNEGAILVRYLRSSNRMARRTVTSQDKAVSYLISGALPSLDDLH